MPLRGELPDHSGQVPSQRRKIAGCRTGKHPDQVVANWRTSHLPVQIGHDSTQSPPDAVSNNSTTDGTTNGVCNPRATNRRLSGRGVGCPEPDLKRSAANGSTITAKGQEVVSVMKSTNQADSRARPLWRREFTMARPALVRMRLRKPCFRARLRTFG